MTLMILNKFKTLYFQNVLLRNMGSLIYLNKKNIIMTAVPSLPIEVSNTVQA